MTVTRQHLTVALVCGGTGAVVGMAGGVLAGNQISDVLVVGLALAVLIVWTCVAGYVGALIAKYGEEKRLDIALALRREGESQRLMAALDDQRARIEAKYAADTEAVNDAVKEGR